MFSCQINRLKDGVVTDAHRTINLLHYSPVSWHRYSKGKILDKTDQFSIGTYCSSVLLNNLYKQPDLIQYFIRLSSAYDTDRHH